MSSAYRQLSLDTHRQIQTHKIAEGRGVENDKFALFGYIIEETPLNSIIMLPRVRRCSELDKYVALESIFVLPE